jgi:carboxyl-terminal processing protease
VVSSTDKLKVNEEVYNGFVKFLSNKNYDYTTESDDKLEELIKAARQEKYFDGASTEFEALKHKLAHDKDKDLQTFRPEISQLLYEELASRYFYQKGRIAVSLEDDPELSKALDVLKDPAGYAAHLNTSPVHVMSGALPD